MRRLIAFFALSLSLGLALPALAQVEPPQPPIPAEAAAPTPNQQPLFAAPIAQPSQVTPHAVSYTHLQPGWHKQWQPLGSVDGKLGQDPRHRVPTYRKQRIGVRRWSCRSKALHGWRVHDVFGNGRVLNRR